MAHPLRYGFKAEAERISLSVRSEISLTAHDRLDCIKLAAYLEIPVVSLLDLRHDGVQQQSIAELLRDDAGFSAMTVCAGTRRIIVFNPHHPRGRRANSLAHELAHVILEHPPNPALGFGGCRRWDSTLEAEADWLAGALLVPRDGALAWLGHGSSLNGGANHFSVSEPLFRWRVNQTGVMRQFESLAKFRGA